MIGTKIMNICLNLVKSCKNTAGVFLLDTVHIGL